MILAYEPIWAIGTGKTASLEEITAMHQHIKQITRNRYPVLYGGSVTPENAGKSLL
jgi:triosephosphate isomerase